MKNVEKRSAHQEAIARVLLELPKVIGGGQLPDALIEQWHREDGFQGNNVEFYSTAEIVERNETFEVGSYCAGYIAIANDGGNMVALLPAKREAQEVFINCMGSMKPSDLESTKMHLEDWIAKDCPFSFEEEPVISACESVRLNLDRMPPRGIVDLVQINKKLGLGLPISELKTFESRLPVALGKMSYIKALRLVRELGLCSPCFRISLNSDPAVQLPLDNPFDKE